MNDIKRLKNCIPKCGSILLLNLVSYLILAGLLIILRVVAGSLLGIIDRPAFTSGDLPYLIRSWQGILVILVGLAVLFVYVAVDLNVTILCSKDILENRKIRLMDTIGRAFANLRLLLNPAGILIVLFIAFIVPLFGGIFGISLTSSFRVPDFILTVINSKPLLYNLYWIFVLAALVLDVMFIFTMHVINLEQKKPKKALKEALSLFRKNRREFFSRMIPYLLLILASVLAVLLIFVTVPLAALGKASMDTNVSRFLMLLFVCIGIVVLFVCSAFLDMAFTLELTALFEEFRGTASEVAEKKINTKYVKRGAVCLAAFLVAVSAVMTVCFDDLFPEFEDESVIIAHRGAGDLDNENTVRAIGIAYEVGADVSEIDIHRTKDGAYILNHDADFSRLCGDPRTPQEMTLEEIRQLRMQDGSSIAALDEIMDAAKGRVRLYIELKGATADRQMVDDVYRMLVEKDMVDQCSMISLNYDVIEYAETTYPEVDTVYLLFFGFGDLEDLKCDSLGLEQESATTKNILAAQAAGKRVDVWTCNTVLSLLSAIRSGANGIITDNPHILGIIKVGEAVLDSDFLRILNVLLPEL